MSADFLLKTAAVLEAAAAVIDEQEHKTQAAIKLAKDEALSALSAQYTELTGEELPSDVVHKLASSDATVLGAVKQVFTKTAGSVESMGRSAEQRTEQRPTNKKESAAAAWDNFGNFINS